MKMEEFIEATNRIEDYYGKEYETKTLKIMYDELKDFDIERYRQIISRCLKNCINMPRVAHMYQAHKELLEENQSNVIQIEHEAVPCETCKGSGFVQYQKPIENGNIIYYYNYAARCTCENGKYISPKIPTYEELNIKI